MSGGYFRAMGIRLLHGREFDDRDTATSQRVAIISRMVANAIDGSGNVLGKRVSVWGRENSREWLTVVGVVDDIRQLGPTQKLHPAVYQPYLQVGRRRLPQRHRPTSSAPPRIRPRPLRRFATCSAPWTRISRQPRWG